jgi:hypothetical protein
MFANKMFVSSLLLPIALLLVLLSLSPPQHSGVHGLIHCERNGVCTGKGEPDGVTCCRGRCHSCTYMGKLRFIKYNILLQHFIIYDQ